MKGTASAYYDLVSHASHCRWPSIVAWGAALLCALAATSPAQALGPVSVDNLVTDNQSVNPAQITDPDLVNAWGVSFLPSGPFWVSDNGTGKSTIYQVAPNTKVTSKVTLPLMPPVPAVLIPGLEIPPAKQQT